MFRHFIRLILILPSCGWSKVHDISAWHTNKLTFERSFAAGHYSKFPHSIQVASRTCSWIIAHLYLWADHINCGARFWRRYRSPDCHFFGLLPQSWPIRNLEVYIFLPSTGCKLYLPLGRTRSSISSFSGLLTLESWRGKWLSVTQCTWNPPSIPSLTDFVVVMTVSHWYARCKSIREHFL